MTFEYPKPKPQRISHSRIVTVRPMVLLTGPDAFGHVVPVELACGHTYMGNPTMSHRVGDLARCHQCDDEPDRRPLWVQRAQAGTLAAKDMTR